MEIQDFIANFCDLLEETDPAVVTVDTKFKELGEWSSLLALSLMAMVAEEYDVELKGDDIRSAITIQDLYNLVKSKLS